MSFSKQAMANSQTDAATQYAVDPSGFRFESLKDGIGMTPKAGDTVRLKVEAIERGTRTDVSRKVGLIERYELGKGDLGKELETMVQGMKIGSERVLPLNKEVSASTMRVVDWARVRDNEAVDLYVRLIGIVGHPCSSDEEEKKKGNLVDFHVCGEVNKRTERIRLFCESGRNLCVEPEYLKMMSAKK